MADVRFKAFVQGARDGKGRNPELKFTTSGKPVLSFNTSESHSRKNQQTGEYENTGYTFRKVTVWGEDAESFQNLADGDLVEIVGREETRTFKKQDGSKGYSFEVTAEFIKRVPTRSQQGNFSQQSQRPPQQNGGGYQNGAKNDPWAQQGGGNYDWGAGANNDEAPF